MLTYNQTSGRTFVLMAIALIVSLTLISLTGALERVHASGTTYYVDSAGGNDNNDGQSAGSAWQSLNKVNGTTFQPGDQILFKAGDTWTGQLAPLGSGNSSAVISIDQYGSGNKPVINGAGVQPATVHLSNQQYWNISDLEVTNTASAPNFRDGIRVDNSTSGELDHIHILNNYIHDVSGYPNGYYADNAAIAVESIGTNSPNTLWNDVLIQGNQINHVDRTGIIVGPDSGNNTDVGSSVGISTNVTVQNNTISDTGGDAIMCYETTGCLVQYNTSTNAGARIGSPCPPAGDYCNQSAVAMWVVGSSNAIFQYNEVTGSVGSNDGEAFDADWGSNNILFQYNYSHDNPGGFIVFYYSYQNVTVRYNISQNDGRVFVMAGGGGSTPSQIYNNTVYIGPGSSAAIEQGGVANMLFTNNIIFNEGSGGYDSGAGGTWDHNLFYGNHPSSEPADAHKITSDPLLANPGGASSGLSSASAYQLQTGSPALGAGAVVSNNGGQDFFGNPVSATSAPNIGAYNGSGVAASLPDLAQNKPATSNNDLEAYGFSINQLTDGNTSTSYTSNAFGGADVSGNPVYVDVDLLSNHQVGEVRLWPRPATGVDGGSADFPVNFTIQTAPDGGGYSTVATISNQANPNGSPVSYPFAPVQARHVRLVVTTLGSPANGEPNNYRLQFAEMGVYSDYALSQTATSNSDLEAYGCSINQLVDGNTGSLYSSNAFGGADVSGNPVYVDVDLASNKSVGQVTLWPRVGTAVGGGSPDFPVNFTIQVAPDGGGYSTVATISNQANPNGSVVSYPFAPVQARHIRVVVTTLGSPADDEPNNYRLQFAEMGIYAGN